MTANPLNALSGMPQMRAAFAGWTRLITLQKVTDKVANGLVKKVTEEITFSGTIQPLSPKTIELKPEGQRAWEWLQIHCLTTCRDLTTNDRIIFQGRKYKIMATNDYSLNNYIEYHAVADYQDSCP